MIKLFSPAKINLFLRIIGKRKDGYHELSSLFQTISLGDYLTFEAIDHTDDILTCSKDSIPLDQSNLILKATHLFRKKTGCKQRLKIHLEKNIPIQAGLGGGSGNAATTLWAFNKIVKNQISTPELQHWSAEIGSDIPFFFSEGTAYCWGRGEHVKDVPFREQQQCWIVKPQIGLSTPEVYKRLKLELSETLENYHEDLNGPYFYNDLEKPAFEIEPQLNELKRELIRGGFEKVVLSGSGSAFFCLGHAAIPSGLEVFKAKYINRSVDEWYNS